MKTRELTKKAFDLLGCFAAALIFTPAWLLISLLIWIDDRGPVYFVQTRIGRHGKPIRVFKFRTMRAGAVTRAGRVLRASGLDELPQYLNVLKGEMSIVGPRPLTADDVERLGWTQGPIRARWSVRPGITGLAQINTGCGAARSAELDLKYVLESSVWLDVKIILVSFAMNLAGKRRAQSALRGLIQRLG
ncbi:MAG TPA: sugar transferase [Bdellovibrionales bacterium]|nr:sugar transferase [Bdellovibrionales bacterium]